MLTVADLRSPLWRRLTDELESRLAELRETNDAQHLDAIKTAAIRGQLAELKRILSLATDASGRADAFPE